MMIENTKKETVEKLTELLNGLSKKEAIEVIVGVNNIITKKHEYQLKVIDINASENHDWMPEDSNGIHQKSEKTLLLM